MELISNGGCREIEGHSNTVSAIIPRTTAGQVFPLPFIPKNIKKLYLQFRFASTVGMNTTYAVSPIAAMSIGHGKNTFGIQSAYGAGQYRSVLEVNIETIGGTASVVFKGRTTPNYYTGTGLIFRVFEIE